MDLVLTDFNLWVLPEGSAPSGRDVSRRRRTHQEVKMASLTTAAFTDWIRCGLAELEPKPADHQRVIAEPPSFVPQPRFDYKPSEIAVVSV